jgi:mono/diheme cytochrome c family protein
MIASPQPLSAEDPGQTVMLAAQSTQNDGAPPPPTPPAYYPAEDVCGGTAGGPTTLVSDRGRGLVVPNTVLPVDIATDGGVVMLVSAGSANFSEPRQLVWVSREALGTTCSTGVGIRVPYAELTSVVYEPQTDHFVAFSREPAQLVIVEARRLLIDRRIALSDDSWRDTGYAIFHTSSGAGNTACASCHPEGRDDGHAWRSQSLGARRTPSLIGTVAGTAPYHWNGEAAGMTDIMDMTFTQRMKGPSLLSAQKDAVGTWLSALPPLRRAQPSATSSAALVITARGRAIFESATARCSSCHTGSMLTNNATLDVGTGGPMQVPSLVGVVHRAPYLHDGSRANLRAVLFAPHGGATVRTDEIDDLATYLESL